MFYILYDVFNLVIYEIKYMRQNTKIKYHDITYLDHKSIIQIIKIIVVKDPLPFVKLELGMIALIGGSHLTVSLLIHLLSVSVESGVPPVWWTLLRQTPLTSIFFLLSWFVNEVKKPQRLSPIGVTPLLTVVIYYWWTR